ncbi:hypothetical protein Avbf_09280 [Armadillidium vulgare]|nr:hypothetical protein Avbf_09280 [Armadillidium vulgare]
MAEALEFRCDLCGRGFASLKGLRVHQQRAHRPEYDHRLLDQRGETKTRWSAEEIFLLAEKELDLERRNVPFMNMALAPLFPGRTLEAIKGKRKQASYKEILEGLRARAQRVEPDRPMEMPLGQEQAIVGSPPRRYALRPRVDGVGPMNIIRQEVGLRGGDLRPPDAPLRPPGVDPVVQHDRVQQDMVQQIPDEQDEREFERLLERMTALGMVVAEPRQPPEDRPPVRDNVLGGLTRSQRKRRNYAIVQNMYKRD